MAQKFLTLQGGIPTQESAIDSSAGAADAGKVPALGGDGRLDESMLPAGIGANTTQATASEAVSAGKFINFFADAGTLKMRLADNTNSRPAHGFVKDAVAADAIGTAYPLDVTNSNMSGLTAGSRYWLGTAGGVIVTPLDATDNANTGKINQLLGLAVSATELRSDDYGYQVL